MKVFGGVALLVALAGLGFVVGCGGSGGPSLLKTTPVHYTLSWGERTRSIEGPSSALSATVLLEGANPVGGDFVSEQDRREDPAAYTQSYVSSNSARLGSYPLTVTFYANAGGTGDIVGTAHGTAKILADGSGIGDVTVTPTVSSVSVTTPSDLFPGGTEQLSFSARDSDSNLVAVSPGSEHWNLVSGGSSISLSSTGLVTANSPGVATISATVDGVTSAGVTVTVLAPAQFQNGDFETPALAFNSWAQDAELVGSMWTGDTHHGIANGSGAWGTGGHSSAQYGFLQASVPNQGSLEQTVDNLVVGHSYNLTYWIARRNGNVGANSGIPISIFANGTQIDGPVTPTTDGVWNKLTTATFAADQTSYHFKFQASPSGGDQTTLLDDVKLVDLGVLPAPTRQTNRSRKR